jgi:O-antigen ligase
VKTTATASLHPAIRWAFYVFILSLPFEYPRRSIPWETTTITCAVFLFAALFQARLCFKRFPAAVAWFGVFLYACLLSFAVNGGEYADEVQRMLILQVQLALLLWAGYNVLLDEEVFRLAPLMLAVACVARAALQVSDIGTSHDEEWYGGERVSALGQNANHSAMIMTAGLLALIGLAYARSSGRRGWRALIWPFAALIALAILQNGSRGGVIALGTGLLTFALGGSGVRARIRNTLAVALALGLVTWASYNNEGLRNRFKQSMVAGAMAGRERVYPELVRMFVERPIVGYSPMANKYVLGGRLPEQHYTRRDAHNLMLEVMTSTGIAGLIPFTVVLGLVWRAAWRARRGPDGILPLAMLVGVLTANLSGNWIAAPLLWFTFAYALASERASGRVAPVEHSGVQRRSRSFRSAGQRRTPQPARLDEAVVERC